MPKLSNKDGELRIYDGSTSRQYVQVLFTQGDFTGPLNRGRVEETLNMDRGNFDQNSAYYEGPDDAIMEPLPITFSAILDSSANNMVLVNVLSGISQFTSNNPTEFDAVCVLETTKGTSYVRVNGADVITKTLADSSKICFDVEILWDTVAGTTVGVQYNEVYFPPSEQSINEGVDNVTINMNGQWYGSGDTLAAFTSGVSI